MKSELSKSELTKSGVFRQLIGDSFCRLAQPIQRVHDEQREIELRGRCDIQRGGGILISLMASLTSLPPTGSDVPVTVRITRDRTGETWRRNFAGHVMTSRLRVSGKLLAERLGFATLLFELAEQHGRLEWRLRGARFLGVPLPTHLFAASRATEECVEGRYTFDVRASLPVLGLLVSYRGWLAEHE